MKKNFKFFKRGMRDGIPIALGYFAVAFALGIEAKQAGLTAFEALLLAGTTNASAGGYAAFKIIGEGGSYLLMAITQLVVNIRYLLMSASLSQKFAPQTSIFHRSLVAFDITDEIFGISIAEEGYLNPFYSYGAMIISIPGWASGAFFGVIMGNVLPPSVVTALSVALYGMFLAIIIPPARKDKVIGFLVVISMALSFVFEKLSFLGETMQSFKVIILTVLISLVAAIFFPKEDEENEA